MARDCCGRHVLRYNSRTVTELHEKLEKLHSELEQAEQVDDSDRELLRTIVSDIQRILERPGGGPAAERHSIVEQLEDTAWRLEESHPSLTSAMSQLMDALSRTFR